LRREELVAVPPVAPYLALATEHPVEALRECDDEPADARAQCCGRVFLSGRLDDQVQMVLLDGELDDLKDIGVTPLPLIAEHGPQHVADELMS
jgi:hypothetical protein